MRPAIPLTAVLAALCGAGACAAPPIDPVAHVPISVPIKVPVGGPILPDGRCEAAEWAGAQALALPEGATLRLRQSAEFVHLCVQPREATWFGVDLYIARPGEAPFNLHASAKLGERVWQAGRWSDFAWWDQAGWVANTSRGVVFDKREFLPDAAREFQIHRGRLAAQFRLMVEVHAQRPFSAPPQARTDAPGGWFAVSLG